MRRQQAGEQPEQHGLASTVGAENDADSFAGQNEIQFVEHHPAFRGETQGIDAQRKHQPYLRSAQPRMKCTATLRPRMSAIRTMPSAIDKARSPLLVSRAMAVVITRV